MERKATEKQRFYGAITVSDRGQIVIPADARRDFNIKVGDKLLVLGDLEQGLALVQVSTLLEKHPGMLGLLQSIQGSEGKNE
ncbi:MAG TPA: AbrB/MazE/SpoVT family DNA-binding domain-containing protein [Anaerolineaceae bacterium]|nr:AbrB/MazE/SpoVT family DNA-binding domain-containing protein [Anaerolineaceae bacterium]HPN50988.1 AbrB/MazE/SpoVT family DNA-binding domain-containing protein [Anaerolineaceae bacterium]